MKVSTNNLPLLYWMTNWCTIPKDTLICSVLVYQFFRTPVPLRVHCSKNLECVFVSLSIFLSMWTVHCQLLLMTIFRSHCLENNFNFAFWTNFNVFKTHRITRTLPRIVTFFWYVGLYGKTSLRLIALERESLNRPWSHVCYIKLRFK